MLHSEIKAMALKAAAVLASNETLVKEGNKYIAAEGVKKRGPHRAAVLIKEAFPKDVIQAWPAIGSKKDDFPQGYNGPTDKYSYQDWDDKKGKNVAKTGYFLNDLADNTLPKCKAAVALIDKLDECLADNPPASADKALLAQGKTKCQTMKKTATDELKAGREFFRKGILVIQQEYAYEEFKSVEIIYDRDDAGELTNASAPIIVRDKARPDRAKPLSVSAFLSLDPVEAMKKGDTFANVIGTTKKGTEDDANKKNTEPRIKNNTEFLGAGTEVMVYLTAKIKELKLQIEGNGQDRDAYILLIGGLRDKTDYLMADNRVEQRYGELTNKIKADEQAEAKAKAAANAAKVDAEAEQLAS